MNIVKLASHDGARLETNFTDLMNARRAKIDEDKAALFEGTGRLGDGRADAKEIPGEWRPKERPQLLEKLRSTSVDDSNMDALKMKRQQTEIGRGDDQLKHSESLMEMHDLAPAAAAAAVAAGSDEYPDGHPPYEGGHAPSEGGRAPSEGGPAEEDSEAVHHELDQEVAAIPVLPDHVDNNNDDDESLALFAAHYYVNAEARRLQAALGISSATAIRLALLHQNAEQELFSSLISGLALFHNPVMARRVLANGEIRRCMVRLDKDDLVVCSSPTPTAGANNSRAQIVPFSQISNVWRNVQNAARADPRKFVIVRCGRVDIALLFVSSTVARVFSQSLQICRGVGHPLYNLDHTGYSAPDESIIPLKGGGDGGGPLPSAAPPVPSSPPQVARKQQQQQQPLKRDSPKEEPKQRSRSFRKSISRLVS